MKNLLLWKKKTMLVLFITPVILLCTSGRTSFERPRANEIERESKPVSAKVEHAGEISSISTDDLPDIMVSVYFKKENVVKEMDLEEYLKGVVLAEMLISYDLDALRAQAIAARTFTLYNMEHEKTHKNGASVCTDYTHCQAWKDPQILLKDYGQEKGTEYLQKLNDAVEGTRRLVLTYEGKLINALYFANSGGWTENVANVWGGEEVPYLQCVASPGEEFGEIYKEENTFTPGAFARKFREAGNLFEAGKNTVFGSIKNIQRTDSGRIDSVTIGGQSYTGVEVRSILDLRSTNLQFRKEENGDITVISLGYGHGVGMSQDGAQAMAGNSKTYEEVLKYYYAGVDIEFWPY